MNYKDNLTIFINLFRSALDSETGYHILTEPYIKIETNEETGKEYSITVPNEMGEMFEDYITMFERISARIKYNTCCLFFDPYDMNISGIMYEDNVLTLSNIKSGTKDLNYSMINAYADTSKNNHRYNQTTHTFLETSDLWFARGNLYEMLPNVADGEYISRETSNVNNLLELVRTLEKKYLDGKGVKYKNEYETIEDDDGRQSSILVKSAVQVFWEENEEEFIKQVEFYLNNLIVMDNSNIFNEFKRASCIIKAVGSAYDDLINKIETFIGNKKKTTVKPDTCMGDVDNQLDENGGFEEWGSDVFVVSRRKYKEALGVQKELANYVWVNYPDDTTDYMSDFYLRKIYTSIILEMPMTFSWRTGINSFETWTENGSNVVCNYFDAIRKIYKMIIDLRNKYKC